MSSRPRTRRTPRSSRARSTRTGCGSAPATSSPALRLLFYFPFLAGLCERLRQAEGTPTMWSRVAWPAAHHSPAAGTASGAFIMGAALVEDRASSRDRVVRDGGDLLRLRRSGAFGGVVLLAAAVVILRTGVLSWWLAQAGTLVGVVAISSTATLVGNDPRDPQRLRVGGVFPLDRGGVREPRSFRTAFALTMVTRQSVRAPSVAFTSCQRNPARSPARLSRSAARFAGQRRCRRGWADVHPTRTCSGASLPLPVTVG